MKVLVLIGKRTEINMIGLKDDYFSRAYQIWQAVRFGKTV